MNQRGFAPILVVLSIILVIGLVIGGSLYLKQKTNKSSSSVTQSPSSAAESSELKTYKNDVFGVTFQYPASYKTENGGGLITILTPNLKYSTDAQNNSDSMVFSVAFSSADKYNSFEELKAKMSTNKAGTTITESIIGGNVKALHIISSKESQQVPVEEYIFLRNGYTFYIHKYPHPTNKQADFDKIISAFKFYQPTTTFQSTSVNLSTAWQDGTTMYSNSNLGITFEYPKTLEVQTPKIDNSLFSVRILTPDIPIEKRQSPEFDFNVYDENTMRILITEYPNTESLSLYDFIAKQNKTYPGNGITDTFDTYKKSLKQTNVPKEGSYVFEGNIGENPRKEVYFEHSGKVYLFGLGGGNNTGEGYSDDANKLFDNILKSIFFL